MSKLSLSLLYAFLLINCRTPAEDTATFVRMQGTTMGTQYQIQYSGPFIEQDKVDLLLKTINSSVSTYDSTSLIRTINEAPAGEVSMGAFGEDLQDIFWDNLALAAQVHKASAGAFDPTILPLVNFWGFGFADKEDDLPEVPMEVIENVGLDKLQIDLQRRVLTKQRQGIELDFSASAKGYAVDKVAELMEQSGISNYLIDIGGEMSSKGDGPSGESWRVGINRPAEDAALSEYEVIVTLSEQSLATSGNYRNYRTLEDGRKVSHSINPKSGYPERTDLLSATIIAKNTALADAWATASMIMGTAESLRIIEELEGIEAFFITSNEVGDYEYKTTSGFDSFLQK